MRGVVYDDKEGERRKCRNLMEKHKQHTKHEAIQKIEKSTEEKEIRVWREAQENK